MANKLPKSTFQSWQQHWEGRKVWAQDNAIPFDQFKQAVQFDYNRMTNPSGFGKPMGDTEAFDALTALKSGHNPFSTPADTPPSVLSDPFGAIRNNVQQIVTGLFHAPEQLAHDFNSAFHGDLSGIANLVPGYTDIHSLFSASGRRYLLQSPISDILDLGGLSKLTNLAESGLRQTGATGAADVLKAIPNHPISTGIKAATITLADHVATVAKVRDGVQSVARSHGWTKDTQEQILRPSRAVKDTLAHVPHPGLLNNIEDFTPVFGHLPKGRGVFDVQHELAQGLTTADRADINDVAVRSTYRGSPMTIDQYLRSSSFTPIQKTAMRGLVKAARNQSAWNAIHGYIKEVRHKDTNAQGWVKEGGSSWDQYDNLLTKAKEKATATSAAKAENIAQNYEAIQLLKNNDAHLPAELNWDADKVKPIPVALRRVADFYRIYRDDLFESMPNFMKRATFDTRINKLFGKGGPLETLVNDLGSVRNLRDADKIFTSIKQIRRALHYLPMPHSEIKLWLEDTLSSIREQTVQLHNNFLKVSKLDATNKSAVSRYESLSKRYDLMWNKHTQGRFGAIVQDKMKQSVIDFIYSHYGAGEIHVPKRLKGIEVTPAMVEKVIQDAEHNYFSSSAMQLLIPKADWVEMQNSAYMFIDEAKMNGADPIFVTAISPAEGERIQAGSTGSSDLSSYVKRSVTKERQPILSDSIYNVWLAIPKESIDIYREMLIDHVIKHFFLPRALTDEEMVTRAFSELSSKYHESVLNDKTAIAREYAKQNNLVPWDPTTPFMNPSTRFTAGIEASDNRMWIYKGDLKLIEGTFKEMDQQLNKVWNVGMQAYRTGVLYASPRFAAHITVGGSVMSLLQMEHPFIDTYKYFTQAVHLARNPHLLPTFMSKGPAEQGIHGELVENPFNKSNELTGKLTGHSWYNNLAGKKLGQLATEANMARTGFDKVAAGLNVYKHFLETVNLTQRSLVYLSKQARTKEADLTEEVRTEAAKWNISPEQLVGARMANKALADMMIVSPMERAILMRYVMPFWGWTRHVLRYVSTFPMDHPLRASIINSLSEQAIGQGSNLPDYLFRLLFLGQPNAQGNVSVLDTRQWNPFRDVANYMTWGGIMSALNPALAAIGQSAFGADPTTGGADLYPELTYDSFYGSSTAATHENYFAALLKQVSPQIDTLTAVMSKTSTLRAQAAANPSKLPYLIADSIGLPWIPYQLNIPQLKIKQSIKQYGMASAAVQKAMIENSLSPLSGYSGYLPYSGYETNKAYLGSLINQSLALNKQSGLNIPASDQIVLPYSSPYFPEYLISGNPPTLNDEQPAHAQGGNPN